MLVHPATPLVVGSALIGGLVWTLSQWSPMPAPLSPPHASIEGATAVDGCVTCHAGGGLAKGCLACHGEIAAQLDKDRGYHHYLMGDAEPACGRCHSEHNGGQFDIVNEVSWGAQAFRGFRHPHVPFKLVGSHARIACESCHGVERRNAFGVAQPASAAGSDVSRVRERQRSFLGLEQKCELCHQDRHAAGLSGDCSRCHGQEKFKPSAFDHGKHFPLTGGHATSDCRKCHLIPDAKTPPRPHPFPFDKTQGKTCAACHETPHTAAFAEGCDGCHPVADPLWSSALGRVTPALHAPAGFRLLGPHAQVACEKCHARDVPYNERYRDRTERGYLRTETTCQGCHVDAHRGQFAARHPSCLDCHEQHRFMPPNFGAEAHNRLFPITGGHAAVACSGCHKIDEKLKVRRFAGSERTCRACHESPHGPQFRDEIAKKDCTNCHEPTATTFKIRPFDHATRTDYVLEGAHYHMAKCESCHVMVKMSFAGKTEDIRRYENTPRRECFECHKDVHRGQFDLYGQERCIRCHKSSWSWKDDIFNHETQSRFKLEGAHAKVACDRCHIPVWAPDPVKIQVQVVQYRPLSMECRSCHDIPTGGKK